MQHLVQHDTTFLQKYLPLFSDSSPEYIFKDCKTSKRAQVKNSKTAQPKERIARTQLTKFAKKISLDLQ